MTRIKIYCFFIIVGYSCDHSNKKIEHQVYISPKVEKIIGRYIASLPLLNSDSSITINLLSKNDSVILSIANSIPDLSVSTFRGLKKIKNYTIYFMGDNLENFYIIKQKTDVPKDILDKNINFNNIQNLPSSKDPEQWIFYFRNDSIIGMFPPKAQVW